METRLFGPIGYYLVYDIPNDHAKCPWRKVLVNFANKQKKSLAKNRVNINIWTNCILINYMIYSLFWVKVNLMMQYANHFHGSCKTRRNYKINTYLWEFFSLISVHWHWKWICWYRLCIDIDPRQWEISTNLNKYPTDVYQIIKEKWRSLMLIKNKK